MPLWVHCPQCDQHYQFPDATAGKQASCPKCGKLLPVVAPAPPIPSVPRMPPQQRIGPPPTCRRRPDRGAGRPMWALPVEAGADRCPPLGPTTGRPSARGHSESPTSQPPAPPPPPPRKTPPAPRRSARTFRPQRATIRRRYPSPGLRRRHAAFPRCGRTHPGRSVRPRARGLLQYLPALARVLAVGGLARDAGNPRRLPRPPSPTKYTLKGLMRLVGGPLIGILLGDRHRLPGEPELPLARRFGGRRAGSAARLVRHRHQASDRMGDGAENKEKAAATEGPGPTAG